MSSSKGPKQIWKILVFTSIFLRIIFAPLIFTFTYLSIVGIFVVDLLDGEFFKQAGYKHKIYSLIDKILDYYWYIFILVYILTSNVPDKTILIFFFILRSFGQLLFFLTKKSYFFFYFPNIFEVFFFFIVLARLFPGLSSYLYFPKLTFLLVIIIPLAMMREYIIHLTNIHIAGFFFGGKTHWGKKE